MDSQIRTDGLYFLKRNSLFAQLGEDVLTELVASLKSISLEKGSTVLRADEPGDSLYLIRNGRVRIASKSDSGQEKPIAYLGRGDAIGELALLTGEPQAFSAIADTPCEFLILTKADFDAILEKHPLIGIHLSRALSKRLAVSFHPPQDKPKQPQLITLVPALPHEAMLLFTINLAIALVEQTRRRVLVLDAGARSGDMARALGLETPSAQGALYREEDLLDLKILQKLAMIHPSGLEFLSLPPKLLKDHLFNAIPPFLSLLKDHYDFILALGPIEKDPLSQSLLHESDHIFFITWDQAGDLAAPVRAALEENVKGPAVPIKTIRLQHPTSAGTEPAHFRVPWSELFHQPLRESGSPYLPQAEAKPAIVALERIARTLGKLRVGLAMGSGAAYGYTLVGILKVFEREGIPIDMVAGTSMGALLGSFYCAGKTPAEIQEISKTITKHWLRQNIISDLTFPHGGFLAGQTLSAFLRSVLGNSEFSQLVLPFAAVATDIRTGQEVVIKEGRVADAVRASTSLPIIFRPFLYKGHYLVDGGLVNPVPTSAVANMGADILISVNLTAKPGIRRGLARQKERIFPLAPRSPNMSEVFFKMLYTMQYEIAQARVEIAHVVIAPDMRDFLWTDFHRSEEILKVGETAAEEAVAKVKTLLPFFADYCRVPIGISLRAY
jgi:NTE family protein